MMYTVAAVEIVKFLGTVGQLHFTNIFNKFSLYLVCVNNISGIEKNPTAMNLILGLKNLNVYRVGLSKQAMDSVSHLTLYTGIHASNNSVNKVKNRLAELFVIRL